MSDYRFVLRAYPSTYRQEHGAEVVDTANELAGDNWSLRQSRSLMVGGLRSRARNATNGSRRSVWASGARVALLVWLVVGVAPKLAYLAGASAAPTYDLPRPLIVLLLIPIAAMTISTKWWVATLITASQSWLLYANVTAWDTQQFGVVPLVVSTVTVVGIAWWLALATDGRRVASPIMAGVFLVVATAVFSLFDVVGASVAFHLIAFVVLILGGLILSRIDPRLTTAGTVLVGMFVAATIPFALGNDDVGWNYWAPIGLSILFLSVMVAASWSGIRRLASA